MWRMTNPDKAGVYLVKLEDGTRSVMEWCGGWNCKIDPITGETYRLNERFDVVAWDTGPFEEFTLVNGEKISINVDKIECVQGRTDHTRIECSYGVHYVKESCEEVMKRIYSHFA